MKNMIRNTWTIFKRNKEFFYLITVQPVIIFLLMSFLLPYSTAHSIAVVNQSTGKQAELIVEALESLEGIKIQDVDLEDVNAKIMSGNIELAVIINDTSASDIHTPEIQVISDGSSEVESAVVLCVEQAIKNNSEIPVSVNEAPEKGMTVSNSLGFMIFKTLTAGNLLAALLIQERNNKMKDRILLSGTKIGAYIGGMSLVYLLFMMVGSVVYYLAGLLLNFDFGMRNSLGFLLVLLTANVLSVALYVFASTLAKKEDSLWFMASFVLLPMALFSGVLFPYEFMPKAMQMVGACFPQRWISHGIEAIQDSGSILSAIPDMLMVLGLSALLFIVAVVRSKVKSKKVITE